MWKQRKRAGVGRKRAIDADEVGWSSQCRYHCDIQEAADCAKLVWATGRHYRADLAEELIFVCDGAQWIWRLVEDNFPPAIQILDWYHAVEYLTPIAQALYLDASEQAAWLQTMKNPSVAQSHPNRD